MNDPTQMTEVAAACTHNSLRRKLVATAVFLLAFAAVVMRTPKPDYVLSDPDAGIQFAGAGQIEFGEHPFIDFRSTYGPLTFYASFVAQRIGGGTIAAELLLCALAYSVAFLLLFFCAREMGGTLIGLICTALALAILPRFYKYYIFLGAALVMASLLGYIRRPGRGRLALLAGTTAIAGLYRPEQGMYAFVSGVTAILIVERSARRALVEFPAMIVAVASPWLIFLVARRVEELLVGFIGRRGPSRRGPFVAISAPGFFKTVLRGDEYFCTGVPGLGIGARRCAVGSTGPLEADAAAYALERADLDYVRGSEFIAISPQVRLRALDAGRRTGLRAGCVYSRCGCQVAPGPDIARDGFGGAGRGDGNLPLGPGGRGDGASVQQ